MREENLLRRPKKRFVATTNSDHRLPVYPNLAADMDIAVPDQLWVSDLTYIRLGRDFVYLAVVLDACSRRCLGWSLGRRLNAGLATTALKMALTERKPEVHHSDRGVQYASGEYTNLLKQSGIQISMSRKGNPYDNAKAESFMKTLKCEQVYLSEYDSLSDAKAQIGHFLEAVYNHKRLHSSLGYLPPAEYEQRYQKDRDKNQTDRRRVTSVTRWQAIGTATCTGYRRAILSVPCTGGASQPLSARTFTSSLIHSSSNSKEPPTPIGAGGFSSGRRN